jgi:hypothetical protein
MTTKLPTKAQVVAALKSSKVICVTVDGEEHKLPDPAVAAMAESVADALVRAGLVEEPREPGWYWVKEAEGCAWEAAGFDDGEMWMYCGLKGATKSAPDIIGPRIHPPKE